MLNLSIDYLLVSNIDISCKHLDKIWEENYDIGLRLIVTAKQNGPKRVAVRGKRAPEKRRQAVRLQIVPLNAETYPIV